MALRDISPTAWQAPGIGRAALDIILSNLSDNPIDLDQWQNSYAPISADTVNWTTAANPNPIALPATTNTRFVLIILPRNNTGSCIIKGATSGDASWYINPNGFLLTTLDPAHIPANMNAVVGANITGVQVIIF